MVHRRVRTTSREVDHDAEALDDADDEHEAAAQGAAIEHEVRARTPEPAVWCGVLAWLRCDGARRSAARLEDAVYHHRRRRREDERTREEAP